MYLNELAYYSYMFFYALRYYCIPVGYAKKSFKYKYIPVINRYVSLGILVTL